MAIICSMDNCWISITPIMQWFCILIAHFFQYDIVIHKVTDPILFKVDKVITNHVFICPCMATVWTGRKCKSIFFGLFAFFVSKIVQPLPVTDSRTLSFPQLGLAVHMVKCLSYGNILSFSAMPGRKSHQAS